MAIILLHPLVIWALCFATIGIGRSVSTLQNALIAHAIAAPLIAIGVSSVYFRRFAYTSPMQTALMFTAFIVLMDFFVVALGINHSLDMFASPLGTWIPFTSIFLAIWLTGLFTAGRSHLRAHRHGLA